MIWIIRQIRIISKVFELLFTLRKNNNNKNKVKESYKTLNLDPTSTPLRSTHLWLYCNLDNL